MFTVLGPQVWGVHTLDPQLRSSFLPVEKGCGGSLVVFEICDWLPSSY